MTATSSVYPSSATARHVLTVFLAMVAARGLAATTTKALAEAAEVNEVTIFRLFHDKAGLVQAAFRHFDLAGKVRACAEPLDTTTPSSTATGLVSLLRRMREQLRTHSALLQFGLSEFQKYPEVRELAAASPAAAQHTLMAALMSARPHLRAEVDIPTSVLSLMGYLLLTTLWEHTGWLEHVEARVDDQLTALIVPLIDWHTIL